MTRAERGFPVSEYQERLQRVQVMMNAANLGALFLTTEPEIRYFTGFLTRFWESPTRPWFLVVPSSGKPVAVIPAIGEHLMSQTWIADIRTWASPHYTDDGIGLLAETLTEFVGNDGKIGVPSGPETHIRMPHGDLARLNALLGENRLVPDADITRRLRMVKSSEEISRVRTACSIADRAFARVAEIAKTGEPLDQIFRRFQALCLDEGADWVGYLAGAAESQGYGDVISPATSKPLQGGDVLMLDTGVVWDGYFCDFDRNYSIGPASSAVADAHNRLIDATQAGFETCRPGQTASYLFHAMDELLTGGKSGAETGRLGHGLGMQLTEWPSLLPKDQTVLEPGMVLTLEPGIALEGGKIMVHEENILITAAGAEY
ncbi:MAG: Xaa-Pro peptidase family protein, partial [Boseongicola sp.]